MLEPIKVEVSVPSDKPTTFAAFASNIADWWPMSPFSMAQGLLTLEQKPGGLIVETAADGERFIWGHITAWEQPDHIAIAWYVGSTVDKATQIDVTFTAVDYGQTLLTLVQSGWEAMGDQAAQVRDRNDAGWRTILGTNFVDFLRSVQSQSKHKKGSIDG